MTAVADPTLDLRRAIRAASAGLAALEKDFAEAKKASEPAEARGARLTARATEAALAAQVRYQPFAAIVSPRLYDVVKYLAAAVVADADTAAVNVALLPELLSIALDDDAWRSVLTGTAATLKELDDGE